MKKNYAYANYPVQGNLFLGRTAKVMDFRFLKKICDFGSKVPKTRFFKFYEKLTRGIF